MSIVIVSTIILGVGIGLLIFFVVKSLVSPKQIAAIANLMKQGRYSMAAKGAKSLISRNPRNAVAHYYLGLCYLVDGKPELGLMEFKTVNQIGQFGKDLSETEFRKRIADLFLKYNQTEEALKEYLLLVKLEPFFADHFYQAGKLFDERNRTDMAVNYLRKAIEIDPRHGKAHFQLSMCLVRDKKPVEAKAEIETSIKYDPDNAQAHFQLGKLQKENHDYSSALISFEKSLKDAALKAKALVERGGCYMSLNNMDKAIPELERAIKIAREEGSTEALYARYFLAMCFEKTRNLDRAIEQWERIYLRKPAFRDVAEKLSQYQEYRSDDRMKDYLSSPKEVFSEICLSITASSMNLTIRETSEIPNGLDVIAVENESGKWLGTRKMPRLVRFLRIPELVEDATLRGLLETMKKLNIVRGSVVTSSGFTRTAMEFAENRPVELFNKDQLQDMLNGASFFSSLK